MAQRRKKRRSTRARKKDEYPGWAWGAWGLAIGLSVAAAVWVTDRRDDAAEQPQARQPASLDNALDRNGEISDAGTRDEPVGARDAGDNPEETPTKRFDFYEMLPNFEVVIPEQEADVAVDTEPKAVEEPGTYVLQAGSFTAYNDADRRRAELALQGIASTIQKVAIDDRTYHRVRIGPTNDLDELNLLRSRLRAAKIDVLRIRLGD